MFLAWEEGALPRAPHYLEDAEELKLGKGKERDAGGRGEGSQQPVRGRAVGLLKLRPGLGGQTRCREEARTFEGEN